MSADSPMWFKSSYSSGEGGECVEVAAHPAAIHIRDSKLPAAHLTVHPSTWASFLQVAQVHAR
ncbi:MULTISPECIES: DUF397 domain-containing protein [Streptomyces]|uniref:DUF397 domain-containing protein n=1 Tax=Streptomyces TaxID=1883 RepID=UPI0016045792|nr:DUF397 domain-containing protein [Streptomyces murinus]MBA9047452.1 hypothetical protein [Streptomyces murinus]